MKILKKSNLALIIVMFFSSTLLFAQHDHSNMGSMHATAKIRAPHGGEIKDIGKYSIEMLTDLYSQQDQLMFFVYKGNFKTVPNTAITGSIVINPSTKNEINQVLEKKGDDVFVAQLSSKDMFHCKVSFTIKGKTITAMFSHEGLGGHHHAAIYTCSMHPEVQNSKPGKCPICGMNLVTK